jgi:hypothetical protein
MHDAISSHGTLGLSRFMAFPRCTASVIKPITVACAQQARVLCGMSRQLSPHGLHAGMATHKQTKPGRKTYVAQAHSRFTLDRSKAHAVGRSDSTPRHGGEGAPIHTCCIRQKESLPAVREATNAGRIIPCAACEDHKQTSARQCPSSCVFNVRLLQSPSHPAHSRGSARAR